MPEDPLIESLEVVGHRMLRRLVRAKAEFEIECGELRSRLHSALNDLNNIERKLMDNIDGLVADVTAETTLIDGVGTLITGLRDQLKAALAGATVPPDVQAKIDQAFATAENNKAKLATALQTNVTPQPSPGPAAAQKR